MHNHKFLLSRKLTSVVSIGAPHSCVSHTRPPPRRRPTRGWHASCSNLAACYYCGVKRGSLQSTKPSSGHHAGKPPLRPPPRSSCSASLVVSCCSTSYKNSAKGKMRWGLVTSRRALDAALVLDNPATREAHSLYERDPMPTCSHIAQSSSAQVLCVVHTKGATSVPGCAQLLPAQGVMGDGWNRAKSSARLPFDVRRTSTVCGAQRTTTPPSSTPCRVCSAPVC
jgi:hypothetical protein